MSSDPKVRGPAQRLPEAPSATGSAASAEGAEASADAAATAVAAKGARSCAERVTRSLGGGEGHKVAEKWKARGFGQVSPGFNPGYLAGVKLVYRMRKPLVFPLFLKD